MLRSIFLSVFIFAAELIVSAIGFSADESESAKQGEVRFLFETGSPPWAGERIQLPPGFARDLGWNGVEEIRFAPGMFRSGEPDFFSYVLVFLLEPGADISGTSLQKELLTYYRGLSKAVMSGKGLTVDTDDFSVSVEKAGKEKSGAPSSAPEAVAWKATLDWVEPFATKERQTLYLEVHTWKHEERSVVLSCVSPVDPKEGAHPWSALRAIREKFRFD